MREIFHRRNELSFFEIEGIAISSGKQSILNVRLLFSASKLTACPGNTHIRSTSKNYKKNHFGLAAK
jgi:hypothetical protein